MPTVTNGSVTLGKRTMLETTVENVGDIEGEQDVGFRADDEWIGTRCRGRQRNAPTRV
ncbi:hypothetical protein ACFOZ7_02660 [Natribaculum luteum]|uniref:Uncharacterized protein n=1 Tax=Natribaculum luteum TaxID=1586232 RepID=A0ABD5NVX9_9EURY|nr:hypothetical protein [Natribaculum luteum]